MLACCVSSQIWIPAPKQSSLRSSSSGSLSLTHMCRCLFYERSPDHLLVWYKLWFKILVFWNKSMFCWEYFVGSHQQQFDLVMQGQIMMVQCGKNICSASHLNENSCNFIEYGFGHTWAQSKQLIKLSQSLRMHKEPNNSMIICSQILQCCNAVTLHWLVSSCVFFLFFWTWNTAWVTKQIF